MLNMKSFSRLQKIVIGACAFTGTLTYYLHSREKRAFASWTTNYEPSTGSVWDENWDHRAPKSLVKPSKDLSIEKIDNKLNEEQEQKTKAVRHLILIRHGQYNTDGRNDEERILTKLGRLQAEYTGKRLKELGFPYSQIVKSTMSRAQETGTIISSSLPQVPVENCDFLREGSPIPPQPPVGHWKPELYQFFQDGARIEAAFRKYFHRAEPSAEKDKYIVLVCHANVIRYFVCRALQFPAEGWLRISLNHASITWISITPSGRCILRTLGDTGHMPPDVITSR